MSKIGKRVLIFHEDTKVKWNNNCITVIGKYGELKWLMPKHNFQLLLDKHSLKVVPLTSNKMSMFDKCMWGTINSRIKNMLDGVAKPFEKSLKIVGIGFRCKQEDGFLNFKLGYSHDIKIAIPKYITVTILKQVDMLFQSIDKELLGSFCAKIRSFAKPEPYLGKGIRYSDEVLKKKVGKRVGK